MVRTVGEGQNTNHMPVEAVNPAVRRRMLFLKGGKRKNELDCLVFL